MAVTGKQVHDVALVLMDEVLETGQITADNPQYYEAKALHIINMLQFELMKDPTPLTNINQNVSVSDKVALSILPYGLASHLLLAEGDIGMAQASFFNARYDELKRKQSTSIEPITDQYNVLGGMQ